MNFVGEGSYSVAEFRKKQENAVEVKEKWKIVGDSVRIFLKATLKKKVGRRQTFRQERNLY